MQRGCVRLGLRDNRCELGFEVLLKRLRSKADRFLHE